MLPSACKAGMCSHAYAPLQVWSLADFGLNCKHCWQHASALSTKFDVPHLTGSPQP